jgi:hypothetical protein
MPQVLAIGEFAGRLKVAGRSCGHVNGFESAAGYAETLFRCAGEVIMRDPLVHNPAARLSGGPKIRSRELTRCSQRASSTATPRS